MIPLPQTCDDCGVCCLEIGSPPFLGFELESLPQDLRIEVFKQESLGDREGSGQPCYWYDQVTRKCKHYEHRPMICRDFEIGSEFCLAYREKHKSLIEKTNE